jgi:hypothetical protein
MSKEIRKNFSYLFDHFDMFGTGAPQFTIDGKRQVGTSMGFISTLFITILMVAYSIIKGW